VAIVGGGQAIDRPAEALANSLRDAGRDVVCIGRQADASVIATLAVQRGADVIELCVARTAGVRIVRELLRELTKAQRGSVSIVVHRIE
jgi:methylmalonyl-CoA mutase cobalamin-binding subunit